MKILKNGTRKLAPKWVGPFTVTERVGSLGYRLELPDAMLVHDVFHVCYLRGYKNDLRKAPPPVPELDDEGEQNWEVDAVLDHKEFQQGRKRKLNYLLRFTGYGPEFCAVNVVLAQPCLLQGNCICRIYVLPCC